MMENGNSVLGEMKANYDNLSSAEKRAAEYILEHARDVVMMNISDLAQRSGSSEATIVRMCKHLGYQGYHQMRLLMSHDIGKSQSAREEDVQIRSAMHLFQESAKRVQMLAESIDMDTLLKAAQIIKTSRLVFVVAAGNTTPIANDLGFRLERYGIPCSYSVLPEQFLNHVSLGTKEDVIIAISRSGASRPVVQAMELAKKKAMRSIVISGEVKTQLSEDADCVLRIIDNKRDIMELDSHLVEMAVSDAIVSVIKHYDILTKATEIREKPATYEDDVELLLSEYKL